MSKDDAGLLRTDPILNQQVPGFPEKPRPRMTHELKTLPEFFYATRNGRKKFELRQNDRDFQVGDQLLLREWDPEKSYLPIDTPEEIEASIQVGYTGRELLVRVDYIMGPEIVHKLMGLRSMVEDYVIMSISHVN